MSEGWLFRLRSSLGAQQAAPAWPSGAARAASDDLAQRLSSLDAVRADDPLAPKQALPTQDFPRLRR